MALYIGIKNLIGKGAAWLRSKWSTIVTQLLATFRYRVAGGADNSSLPERKGRAILQKVYGKTVKFNQVIPNGDFSDGGADWTSSSGSTISFDGNKAVLTATSSVSNTVRIQRNNLSLVAHKYYLRFDIYAEKVITTRVGVNGGITIFGEKTFSANVWNRFASIATLDGNADTLYLYCNRNSVLSEGDTVLYKNVILVDLTAAETDNLTTPEEVEAWLALNVGAQDYYPYDEGSLVSFKGSALQVKKDGAVIDEADLSHAYINVWDEIVEDGGISTVDGSETTTAGYRRSKSFIPVKGGTSYYIKTPVSMQLIFYNANKTFISAITALNEVRTTPQNCAYMRFRNANANAWPTYNHDICINVSNTDINGTYYPHALQSAGSVTDEVTESVTDKKLGSVLLSSLTWSSVATNTYSTPASFIKNPGANSAANVVNVLFVPVAWSAWSNNPNPIRMAITPGGNLYATIPNTDLTSFMSAINGIEMVYELATPIVVPHDTPMQYKVDKHSTEEVIFPDSADGSPTSTAIVADIEYQAK